jgi:hypothetical protein
MGKTKTPSAPQEAPPPIAPTEVMGEEEASLLKRRAGTQEAYVTKEKRSRSLLSKGLGTSDNQL